MAGILTLSPSSSMEKILDDAAAIILQGGVIAYPTETFYGLGVDATRPEAVRKIFEVKGRDFNNPVAVIIGDMDQLPPLVRTVSEAAQKLMDAFWPGPLTILFEASENVQPMLTAGTGKIGVRLSSHKFARRLSQMAHRPITATSANLSGASDCVDATAVIRQIGTKLDAIVDLGERGGTIGSTIIDATPGSLSILRPGMITREGIEQKTGLKF